MIPKLGYLLGSPAMKMETIRYLLVVTVYSLALFGLAFLVGCTPVKYAFDCTVVQPRNCN